MNQQDGLIAELKVKIQTLGLMDVKPETLKMEPNSWVEIRALILLMCWNW